MLATSSFHSPSSSPPFAFLPTQPSPLSPRSANIHGPRVSMSSRPQAAGGQENLPFSKRPVKKAPSPKQDDLKERRRDMFLKKVKQGREDKRFENRGEDIMRLDFMQRRKQWEAEQARDAPFIPSDPLEFEEEEEYDLPTSSGNAMQLSQPSTQLPALEEVADEVAQMEDQELEALLEYMPVGSGDRESEEAGAQTQNLWSDDDDYDELFSELMEQDGGQAEGVDHEVQQQQQQSSTQDAEAMDMS